MAPFFPPPDCTNATEILRHIISASIYLRNEKRHR